jgi:hypothetical protein
MHFVHINCNMNNGGYRRTRTNSTFSKLSNLLNINFQGIGYAAHVIQNCVQKSADTLPTDTETVLNKIFHYFHIYNVWVEEL